MRFNPIVNSTVYSGTFAWQVKDNGGGSDTLSETMNIATITSNDAPTLNAIPNVANIVPGATFSFTATANDPDPITTLTFSLVGAPTGAMIDPDIGVFTWTPNELNLLGTYVFKVRVIDDGTPALVDTETIVLNLLDSAIIDGDLVIGGTGGNDTLTVTPSKDLTQAIVKRGADMLGTYSFASVTGQIVVYGLGGHDKITISPKITKPSLLWGGYGNDVLTSGKGDDVLHGEAGNDKLLGGVGNDQLFGGSGNDVLTGGTGNNLLVGGDGNDALTGGVGRDVLLGGAGIDKLSGGNGDDLLLGGITSFASDPTSLNAIIAEWNSVSSYTERLAHLTGTSGGLNSSVFLNATTVFNDSAKDIFLGGGQSDYFIVSLLDTLDLKAGEVTLTI
jgi:Ca2+-binding RTX toxin-like protein